MPSLPAASLATVVPIADLRHGAAFQEPTVAPIDPAALMGRTSYLNGFAFSLFVLGEDAQVEWDLEAHCCTAHANALLRGANR